MDDFATGYLAGQDSGGGGGSGNGGFFGGDGIWAILLFALIFGYGGNGFGGGGGRGGCVTQADLCSSFNFNNMENAVRGIQQGICESTYALNNSIMGGFHGVDNAVCTLGYNVQSGFNGLGHQISDCCCTTQRAIDGVNYNMATQFCALGNTIQSTTRDIIDANNANYRGIMDFLVSEKLSSKDAQIAQLQNQLSQSQQNATIRAAIDASTAEIIRRTGNECPIPAYVVPNPNCCYGNPTGVGYGFNAGGCGCGCG